MTVFLPAGSGSRVLQVPDLILLVFCLLTDSRDQRPPEESGPNEDFTMIQSDGQKPAETPKVPVQKTDPFLPDESDSTKSRRLTDDYDSTKYRMDNDKYQGTVRRSTSSRLNQIKPD